MKYAIAYGRNLDLKRMAEKCPHCVLAGKTFLKDWQIAFKKYITLEKCKGAVVPVGVWEVNDKAEKELDVIEGYPTLYRKQFVEIEFKGKKEKALVYLINDKYPKYPDKNYLQRLLNGYNDFNFDRKFIDEAIERLPKKKVLILTKKNADEYVKACQSVGIETIVDFQPKSIKEFDGLLIPGGGDIDPKSYGQENISCQKIDLERDKQTFKLIKKFINSNKAILGICMGCQYINVYFGGTLKQNINGHKDTVHNVIAFPSIVADYLGESFIVNSLHHQCVDNLGKDLEIVAKSTDDVVEAIYNREHKILGIQWHPEKLLDKNGIEVFEIFKTLL